MIKNAVRRCLTPVAPHHGDVISREHLQHSRSPTAAQTADQTLLLHVNEAKADLSLYRLEENALSKHAAQLHQLTGGYFKALTYVISTAAVIAIHSGSENITEKKLKAATAQLGPWQPAAGER
ncbi:hypothetical protein ACWEQ1_35020 [Streptomyces nodosus]